MIIYQYIKKIELEKIILLIIPISLITGPLIPDLLMVSFSFYSLSLIFKKNIYLKFYRFFLFFLILYLYLLFRSLLSDNILLSLESSLFYLRYPLFSIGFGYFLYSNYEKIHMFCYGAILGIFLLFIDGIFQFIFGYNILGFEIINVARVSSFFKDELIMGSYVSRIFPIIIFSMIYLFRDNNKKLQLSYVFSILICFILVYISGERTALAIFIIANFLLLIHLKIYRKVILISVFLISVIILIINSQNEHLKNRLFNHTINQLTENSKTINFYSKVHQQHIYSAYLMFKDNIVFGKGPKTFRHECIKEKFNPKGCSSHPHNIFFQILAETGMIGLIFLLCIYYICVFSMSKIVFSKNVYDTYKYLSFVTILINLVPFFPSGNIFNNWLNFIFYLPVALLVFIKLFEDKDISKT